MELVITSKERRALIIALGLLATNPAHEKERWSLLRKVGGLAPPRKEGK